jgi:hypothetical protein
MGNCGLGDGRIQEQTSRGFEEAQGMDLTVDHL